MKNFLMSLSLILISTFVVFSQETKTEKDKNETLAFTEQKPVIDKIKIEIIKDDEAEISKIITDTTETKEIKNFARQQNSVNEYNKNEFYVGYSYQNVDRGSRDNFNGFNASYVRNVKRYFGVKADVSGAYRNDSFSISGIPGSTGTFAVTGETRSSLYNFLGGVQFKDNASEKRFKPFAHALAGVALLRISSSTTCTGDCPGTSLGTQSFSDSAVRFSSAFGGGLDIKINDKIDFRAIQFDYNPIFTGGGVDNNFRVGVGIVFK